MKLDHIGNIPTLISNHISVPLITTRENRLLLEPLLLDGAYIIERNMKALQKQKYKVEPIYNESDVYLLMNNVIEKEMHKVYKLNDRVSYEFVNSGHILGGCQLIT